MTETNNTTTTVNTYSTAIITVAQSLAIHPEWDAATHAAYLESELGLDLNEEILLARWPEVPRKFPLRDFVANWVKWPDRCLEVAARIAAAQSRSHKA